MTVPVWLKDLGVSGALDILLMALLIYTGLLWFKKARAASVLTGILIVSGIYLLARQFNLYMLAAVFEKFFAVILVALVVIFQEELRYLFERIAVWSLNRKIGGKKESRLGREEVAELVRTVTDLARDKIGALIVIRGKNMIARHLDGGIDLNGRMSEPLLKSIFDPHSAGHDGAVIIEGGRISQFACHLPLTKNVKKVGRGGTRHSAALGLAELCDALSIVVSEERGVISLARSGDIVEVSDPEALTRRLEAFYQEIYPKKEEKFWQGFFKRNSREKITAAALSFVLWFVLVNGSKIAYKTYTVPVKYGKLTAPFAVSEIAPGEIDVTFRGSRRAFYFVTPFSIRLSLEVAEHAGTQRFRISAGNLVFPKNMVLEDIEPHDIAVKVEKKETGEGIKK